MLRFFSHGLTAIVAILIVCMTPHARADVSTVNLQTAMIQSPHCDPIKITLAAGPGILGVASTPQDALAKTSNYVVSVNNSKLPTSELHDILISEQCF